MPVGDLEPEDDGAAVDDRRDLRSSLRDEPAYTGDPDPLPHSQRVVVGRVREGQGASHPAQTHQTTGGIMNATITRDLVTDLQLIDSVRGLISLFSARQPPDA